MGENNMEIMFIALVIIVAIFVFYKPRRERSKLRNYMSNTYRNKQKGDEYELQIGRLYQQQGYKVYFKGINEGKRDNGVDLIAYKDNEVALIQCKNWENTQVKQEHLRIFLGDCTAYLEKNRKIFAKKNVSRVFVTSCKNIDYGVKKFLEENSVGYRVIPYDKVSLH